MKSEVRAIAEAQKLPSAKRKDSQGICFLGKINYNDFIERYLGKRPGKIVELETVRSWVNTMDIGSIRSANVRDWD